MTVRSLADALSWETLCAPDAEREVRGCYTGDLLSWVMGRAKADNVWVTIMTNINTVAVATLTDVSCVVIADGAEIADDVVQKASEKGVNLYRSQESAYALCAALARLL